MIVNIYLDIFDCLGFIDIGILEFDLQIFVFVCKLGVWIWVRMIGKLVDFVLSVNGILYISIFFIFYVNMYEIVEGCKMEF